MRAKASKTEKLTVRLFVWKGPFVDGYLLAQAEKTRAGGVPRSSRY